MLSGSSDIATQWAPGGQSRSNPPRSLRIHWNPILSLASFSLISSQFTAWAKLDPACPRSSYRCWESGVWSSLPRTAGQLHKECRMTSGDSCNCLESVKWNWTSVLSFAPLEIAEDTVLAACMAQSNKRHQLLQPLWRQRRESYAYHRPYNLGCRQCQGRTVYFIPSLYGVLPVAALLKGECTASALPQIHIFWSHISMPLQYLITLTNCVSNKTQCPASSSEKHSTSEYHYSSAKPKPAVLGLAGVTVTNEMKMLHLYTITKNIRHLI